MSDAAIQWEDDGGMSRGGAGKFSVCIYLYRNNSTLLGIRISHRGRLVGFWESTDESWSRDDAKRFAEALVRLLSTEKGACT